jgi:hypothetical protein
MTAIRRRSADADIASISRTMQLRIERSKLTINRGQEMLEFFSASVRIANPQRAVQDCIEVALGSERRDCDLVVINASIGHNLHDLVTETRRQCPGARVVASSCAGVIGREGVSESMKDVALMAIRGREFVVAHVDGIFGHNSFEKATLLARALKQGNPAIDMVYLIASGLDIANDHILAAFDAVLGPAVTVFGATAADNYRCLTSVQAVDDQVFEHAAFAVGFADPTLEVHSQATHGFIAVGEPLVVTRAEGHKIFELNGKPAWPEYRSRLGLPATADQVDTVPIGALAERLPPELARAYGNDHILRAVTGHDAEGALHYATTCPVGTPLWLTIRDEERIFTDVDRLTAELNDRAHGRKPVAVFHADCAARGRLLFNRVMKEELMQRIQHPFATNGEPPPWLGMYGFGEYARLGGVNSFHNYTTALAALYRR